MIAAFLAAGWQTMLISQLLGFGLVLAFLYRFVWGHLTGFLSRRREQIRHTFEEIDRRTAETAAKAAEARAKLDGIAQETQGRMARAAAEGERTSAALLAEARASAQAEADKVSREIGVEGDKAVVELRLHVVSKVLAAAEGAVRAGMTPELNGRIVERTLEDLAGVKP